MMGTPDADPAGTAAQLEAIKAKITTPDAELVENLAAAYTAIAANPADTEDGLRPRRGLPNGHRGTCPQLIGRHRKRRDRGALDNGCAPVSV
jgi:hypothetical protein